MFLGISSLTFLHIDKAIVCFKHLNCLPYIFIVNRESLVISLSWFGTLYINVIISFRLIKFWVINWRFSLMLLRNITVILIRWSIIIILYFCVDIYFFKLFLYILICFILKWVLFITSIIFDEIFFIILLILIFLEVLFIVIIVIWNICHFKI